MPREMKESGVEWIGIIPKTWTVLHCNAAFIRKNEKAEQDDPVILSLARSGVKVRDISNNEGQLAESYYNYNPVEPGDLLLNTMDLVSGANCSISEVSGVISPAYVNLRARKGFDPLYYDYYFKTQYWSMAFFAHGKGVSFDNRWTLSAGDVLHYSIPVPPENEQKRIAAFLKKKIDAIDKVVIDTENSINGYKKLEQSIITETVINGIKNKNKEIKYSGFEYIGDIPKYWRIAKVKTAFERKNKKAEQEDPIILSLARSGVRVRDISNNEGQLAESYYNYNPVEPGDLLLNPMDLVSGANCSISNVSGVISPAYINLKAKDGFNPRYYDYYFKIQYWSMSFFAHGRGVSFDNRWTLSVSDLFNYPIIVPPKEEQDEIAAYLDQKCGVIENIIEKKNAFIQNMNDYKKSIIYEYVTGKKEVPEL